MSGNKAKVAVLDDWQGVARQSADWFELESRADVTIFADAFSNEDDAASQLADFDIVLSMRERMEAHRRNPVCANCHRMFDPIGSGNAPEFTPC